MEHDLRVEGPILQLYIRKEKTLEVRLAYDWVRKIEVGHTIRFNRRLSRQVVARRRYKTLEEVVAQEAPEKIHPDFRGNPAGLLAAMKRHRAFQGRSLRILVFELQ